ncbi:Crp/Fnr family transcriptional regulator [Altererythrobacter sp. GH1-8]|uniref:Crp/Fnr family transcriptional regulator n=1 Tax=Altererythrobacter sp. GH1-8 TaxID=3349333 RepID=UPI00374DF6C2
MMDLTRFRPKPFLSFLDEGQVARLKAAGNLRRLTDGQYIHSRGDTDPGISIIESGAAKAGIYGTDGEFILTSFLGPGHSFGEFTVFTDIPLSHDISAVGPTSVIRIPSQRFLELGTEEPAYLSALMRATLMRSHILLEMLHAIRILPLVPRVAKFLLVLTPPPPAKPKVRFKQTDLAATIGLSRASMNRALTELEKVGLIERSYGAITITSSSDLLEWLRDQSGDY